MGFYDCLLCLALENPEKIINEPIYESISDNQLESSNNVEQLEQFGMEVLKVSLIIRGLKCGGTIHERASRLFSVKNLLPSEYPTKLLAKPKSSK